MVYITDNAKVICTGTEDAVPRSALARSTERNAESLSFDAGLEHFGKYTHHSCSPWHIS